MPSPKLQRVIKRVDKLDSVVHNEQVNILQIPNEQIECIVVVPGINRLREVDNDNAIFHIQNVVGGKVRVNAMLNQEQFDVAQDPFVNPRHFASIQCNVDQDRSRALSSPKYSITQQGLADQHWNLLQDTGSLNELASGPVFPLTFLAV